MASAGFTKPSDDDERGWLWFVSILSIIYSLCFFGVRIFGKYEFLWWDDLCLGVGYLVAFARSGLTMSAIRQGLGVDLDGPNAASESTLKSISRDIFVARVLLQVCLYSSKASISLFTRRIFSGDMGHEKAIFVAYFTVLALSCLAAMLLSSVQCDSVELLSGHACGFNKTRWIIISVLDVATEVLIIVVPAYFLTKLQMGRADKRRAMTLFAFRLGVIGLTIALTATYLGYDQAHVSWSEVVVLQEALLTYSFISATIPCVRSFLGAFFSPFLTLPGFASALQGSTGNSIALQSVSKKSEVPRVSGNTGLRPDHAEYEIDIRHSQKRRADGGISVASDDSERMMIRRQTEVYVHTE